MPTAALEALALGTPVVVSSDAVLDPVISDRRAYKVFESNSVDSAVREITSVLEDTHVRERMSALGKQAVAELDWSVVTQRVMEWYYTVLRQHHSFA